MICPKCGVENPAENADCAKCGASLSEGLTLALPDDGKSSVSPEDHTVGLPQDRASAGTEGWSVPAAAADPQLSIPGQVSLEAGAVLARFGLVAFDFDVCRFYLNCYVAIVPLDSGFVLALFGT